MGKIALILWQKWSLKGGDLSIGRQPAMQGIYLFLWAMMTSSSATKAYNNETAVESNKVIIFSKGSDM